MLKSGKLCSTGTSWGAYMGLLAPPSESVFNGLIDLADANIFSETKIVGVWGGSMASLSARDANASKNE